MLRTSLFPVSNYILAQISEQEKIGVMDFVVIEAALLIEEHYEEICDELWYIHAEEENNSLHHFIFNVLRTSLFPVSCRSPA